MKKCYLKKYRQKNGLSRQQLSNESGIPVRTIKAWETEERYPSFQEQDKIHKLAKLLNCSISDLLPDMANMAELTKEELEFITLVLSESPDAQSDLGAQTLTKCRALLGKETRENNT